MTSSVSSQAIWAEVKLARLELCEWLDSCDAADWSTPSLCEGWTVQDVIAHLTLSTRTTKRQFISAMIRSRGDFDRMEADRARRRAKEHSPSELVQQIRQHADSTQLTLGSSALDTLIDVVVHGQDIARPAGRDLAVPPGRVLPALDHAIASRWYGARKRLADTKLAATDIDWTSGAGSIEIRKPAIDLLLFATGRSVDGT